MGDEPENAHALWVFAHPRGDSLNATLRDVGVARLRADGWSVDVADLYAEGFDPILVDEGGDDVRAEQRRLLAADLVVLPEPSDHADEDPTGPPADEDPLSPRAGR